MGFLDRFRQPVAAALPPPAAQTCASCRRRRPVAAFPPTADATLTAICVGCRPAPVSAKKKRPRPARS